MISLDPKTTAVVLIDIQKGILRLPLTPHSASDVITTSCTFTETCRRAGATVVLVNVDWSADHRDALSSAVDKPLDHPELPADWSVFADGLQKEGDLVVTKRQWGAFYGTDMDLQLRRRGIKTIILGGIVTNFGVESTARTAWEHGYELVIPEDLSSAVDDDMHRFAMEKIFPRISRVTTLAEIQFTR
jgi:nicotinamidase-related amidase